MYISLFLERDKAERWFVFKVEGLGYVGLGYEGLGYVGLGYTKERHRRANLEIPRYVKCRFQV